MNVVTDGTTAEPVAEKDHFVPEYQSDHSGICVNSGETWAVVPELSHEIMSQEQGLYMYIVAMLVMSYQVCLDNW